MYTSIDPERPYAGKRLALHIEERTVAAYGSLNGLLVACGFEFVENTFGDKLYKHATTGEVIRMKYINRDAWQVEREPVEEPKKARKRISYTVTRECANSGSEADDGLPDWLPLDNLTYYREDAALRALEAAVYRAAEQQALLDRQSAHDGMKIARAWTKRHPMRDAIRIGRQRVLITIND